jgi:ATP-dependent Lhr-like helicase
MESTGPMTATQVTKRLAISRELADVAFGRLEATGEVLRGRFTPEAREANAELEWCNRRILARIHRMTIGRLRREIEPVSSADFMRFLFSWQHVASGTQLHGVDGLFQTLKQLQGYEVSASSWETEVLPRRVARYAPEMLDQLCLSGEVMWGRLSPHPAFAVTVESSPRGRRVRPTRVAPVSIFLREDAPWLLQPPANSDITLSPAAREVFDSLSPRTTWSSLRPPVFWRHDVGDRFEPVSEAERAAAPAHAGPTRFQRTALLSHAAALGAGAKEKGVDFWAQELSGLLLFSASALGEGE